ncbi:hypothetical protein Tco_0800862 [Tanacetum coccineum]|uniref:Uncharacterized protein n=1 Tax=Tanacetum coccineum TaxID=301880 RepID=A0ABQ4ZUD7_9ASTR
METKDILSSCLESKEQEIQRMQKQAKILKKSSMNKFNALKTTTQRLERQTFTNSLLFQRVLKTSNYEYEAREARENFKDDTQIEAQTFKEILIQNMNSIEKCIVERALHEQEIQNSSENDCSKTGNNQSSENQGNTSGNESSRSGNEYSKRSSFGNDTDIKPSYDTEPMAEVPYTAEYNVFAVETQHTEQPKNMNDTSLMEKVDSNTTPDSSDMCNNEFEDDQNQLRNANATLTHELNECKSDLEESNGTRDKCRCALHHNEIELDKYKRYKDCTIEKDKVERKLKETLSLLAQQEIDSKEALKTKEHENFLVKEKNNELVKQSSLEHTRYVCLLKEKDKLIHDFRIKEEKDIDKLIALENQVKFLNEIIYKRNQSVQTIHMLAPNLSSSYNGRPSFANPKYLKNTQSKKPCLYQIPYDKDDLANIFAPNREETLTLEQESRSKLHKETVKHKSRQAFNTVTHNINHFKTIVDLAWEKRMENGWQKPTIQEITVLVKNLLIPLAIKSKEDAFEFENALKKEMFEDLEYVKSLEKEVDVLESEKADFSNEYDLLVQDCISKDIMCTFLHSLANIDEQTELQCLYLEKIKERKSLTIELSKQTENICKEDYNELLKSFSKLEQHSISLELTLQQCPSRNRSKRMSFQSPKESVGSNDMVHNHYLEEAKKKAQHYQW